MKLCPTCGEVYPDQSNTCRAHDATLLDWTEVSDSGASADTPADDAGPFADTAQLTQPGDLTDPEVPLHAAPTPPPTVEVSPSLLAVSIRPARVLGRRYRLGERIGIGGYGAVFDAYDERLRKRVAVKVLSPVVAQDADVVRRFEREALAASRVRHECIVDVTDFAIDAEGTSFIVMEYLDGCDLSEVLADEGPLPPARALAIAVQCASALTAAHAAGILHRDLKPANIFLLRSASRPDFVKIIDFGISKVTNADGHFSDVTSASKVVGTPFYMAPEQAQGKALDGRTDLYALGIILFEMLTGERPFIGASALEILTNAMNNARVPPSREQPQLAEIAGLDELVLRAIAANRDHRYDSMRQFGDQIVACLSALDTTRALGLPAIVPEAAIFESNASPRATRRSTAATELVDPSMLESSSGEVTAPRQAAPMGRWRWPLLGAALLVATLVVLWASRADDGGTLASHGAPPAPTAAAPPAPVAVSKPPPPSSARETPARAASSPESDPPAIVAPETEPAPAEATIRVTSAPSRATVSSRRRGPLGTTPLDVSLPDDDDDELIVRYPGRAARTVPIARTTESPLHVALPPERPPRPKATPRAPTSKPAKPEIGIKDW